jgi:hypothetical protein
MDELIKIVSAKTGLPADKAQAAVSAVLEFLKDRLPAPLAGQIDGIVGGGKGDAGDVLGGLGGLLGKK